MSLRIPNLRVGDKVLVNGWGKEMIEAEIVRLPVGESEYVKISYRSFWRNKEMWINDSYVKGVIDRCP